MNRQIGVEESKYGVTGDPYLQVVNGSRDLLFEFWDPSISLEQLELETSNLAADWTPIVVRVWCRRKESSRSLSHLLMSFLSQTEVVITAVDWAILSKFFVEIDFDIVKRVLSLKPKLGSGGRPRYPTLQPQFWKTEKSIWRCKFAVSVAYTFHSTVTFWRCAAK